MTPFQNECERRIVELADQLGQQVRERRAEGEKYLTGKIDEFQYWIYDSGDADFKSDWFSKVFEQYDFDSEEQLIDALIKELRFAIENKKHLKLNPQSTTRPFLNRLIDKISTIWKK